MKTNVKDFLVSPYTIYLYGEIDTEMAASVVQKGVNFCREWIEKGIPENERYIVLRINSLGGSIVDGMDILDNLNAISPKVVTIAEGMAASMGAFLLCSGTKGYRLAMPNSEILIHQPLGGIQGQAADLEIAVTRMKKVKQRLNKLMAEATGKSIKEIEYDTDRDNYMSPIEAKNYGLIDAIIENNLEVMI